jgi:hypothetical protein
MKNLNELALTVVEMMQETDYSNVTAWRTYLDALLPVVRFHKKRGLTTYDPMVTADFCNQLQERRLKGTHNAKNATRILASISRLQNYYETGNIDYAFPKRVSNFTLNEFFRESFNRVHFT